MGLLGVGVSPLAVNHHPRRCACPLPRPGFRIPLLPYLVVIRIEEGSEIVFFPRHGILPLFSTCTCDVLSLAGVCRAVSRGGHVLNVIIVSTSKVIGFTVVTLVMCSGAVVLSGFAAGCTCHMCMS